MAAIASLNPSGHYLGTLQGNYPAHARILSGEKNHPAAQSTCRKCCAERHLKGAMLAVYQRARRVTYKNGGEYYESAGSAADAIPYSRWTIGEASKLLARAGWFVLIESNRESGRKGVYKPTRYRVVPHEEWALSHPGQCGPRRSKKSPAGKELLETQSVSGFHADREGFPLTVPRGVLPCGETAHNVLNKNLSTNTSTSTSENKRKKDHDHARLRDEVLYPRGESRQEAASARPGEPSDQTGKSLPVCSDVDVDLKEKPKRATRERQGRRSPWDIDEEIARTCAMSPEDDPDKLFCWHVFGGRFQFQNGFKNDTDGDRAGFMEVARECYEYAKENWTWDGDDVKANTNQTMSVAGLSPEQIPPYACIKGIVKFMTLVADKLAEGEISARCFFAALAQARAERTEAVEEHRKKQGY